MKFHLRLALIAAGLAVRLAAAEDASPIAEPAAPPPPQPSTLSAAEQQKLESAIRERLAEHTLEKASKNAPATHAAPPAPAAAAGKTAAGTNATTTAANAEVTTLLPRVEVNQSRITELAIKEHEKDLEIAREKQLTKPTALDSGLNDSEVSQKLAILGGSSADERARVAQERVSLLEAEKDLLDEIARAPTKEERADLQKQLNDLKTMRRELEREPRDERK